MGGSLIARGIEASSISLKHDGLQPIYSVLIQLSNIASTGWDSLVPVETYLAGSSSCAVLNFQELMNRDIYIGDIDILVDRVSYDKFKEDFARYATENDIYFSPTKMRSVSMWGNVQVDFIPCEFDNGIPTEFFRLSHSSAYVDIIHGVKGFAHKLLLRAACAQTNWHFSVDYGMREDATTKYIASLELFKDITGLRHISSFRFMFEEICSLPMKRQIAILERFNEIAFLAGRQKSSRFPEKDRQNLQAIKNMILSIDRDYFIKYHIKENT